MEMYQIKRGNKVRGPYSRETIAQGIADGRLLPSDLISIDGDDEWQKLGSFKTFREIFPKANQAPNEGEASTNSDIGMEGNNIATKLKRYAPIIVISFAVVVIGLSFIYLITKEGNKKSDEVNRQVLEVGSTVDFGELKVKVEWAKIFNWQINSSTYNFAEHSYVPGLVIKIRIKTEDNTKKYGVRGAIKSASVTDNLGNKLNPLPPKTSYGALLFWSNQLDPDEETMISSQEDVLDCLVFEIPVKAAEEITLKIDTSIYGRRGEIVYRIPLKNTEMPKDNAPKNQKDQFDLGQQPGVMPNNLELLNGLLKQGNQNQLAQLYASIPKEKQKKAREYIALKATNSEPNVQVAALFLLENIFDRGDGLPDEMIKLVSNPNSLVRRAACRFLFKISENTEEKLKYAKAALADKDEGVISVGIEILSTLRLDNRAMVLTELFNLCGNPSPKVRSKAEEQLLLLFKPFGQNDLLALNENKNNKGVFIQATFAKVLGLFDQPNNDVIQHLEGLANSPEPSVSIEAIKSLRVYGAKAEVAVASLVNLAANKNQDIRKEALVALAIISMKPEFLSLVFEGIGDPSEEVSKACSDVIERVNKFPNVIDIKVVENTFESPNQKVREAAYGILVKNGKGKQEYSSTAIKGLEDKSEEVKRLSLLFLQDLKNLDAEAYKKLAVFLESNANRVDQAKLVPICLRLLKNGKEHSKEAVPILKTMLTMRQEQDVRDEVFALIEAIGPDASQLVDELIKNVSPPDIPKNNPQNQNAKQNQIQINNLATYRRIFLEHGENEKIRKAISFLGKPGAKEVGKYLSNQDPAIRFFALVCIQSLGKEATDQLPSVYKLTLAINEKVPFILQQAKETYGTIR